MSLIFKENLPPQSDTPLPHPLTINNQKLSSFSTSITATTQSSSHLFSTLDYPASPGNPEELIFPKEDDYLFQPGTILDLNDSFSEPIEDTCDPFWAQMYDNIEEFLTKEGLDCEHYSNKNHKKTIKLQKMPSMNLIAEKSSILSIGRTHSEDNSVLSIPSFLARRTCSMSEDLLLGSNGENEGAPKFEIFNTSYLNRQKSEGCNSNLTIIQFKN